MTKSATPANVMNGDHFVRCTAQEDTNGSVETDDGMRKKGYIVKMAKEMGDM
jgi:hypothetical protein